MKHGVLLGIVSLLFAVPAMGFCQVPQPRLVCAEYFASKLVVEATLVKVKTIRDKSDPEGIAAFAYSLRADRVLRGQMEGVFRVYEENDSGRAGFDWKVGRRYLLFLLYLEHEKSWGLDGCGNSGPVEESKSVFEQIDKIKNYQGEMGMIHGVVSEDALSSPIAGVRVEARGDNSVFRATTNAKGEFEIKVHAGRYSVHAITKGAAFVRSDFSYENTDNLRIEPGGCAQVQLARKSGK